MSAEDEGGEAAPRDPRAGEGETRAGEEAAAAGAADAGGEARPSADAAPGGEAPAGGAPPAGDASPAGGEATAPGDGAARPGLWRRLPTWAKGAAGLVVVAVVALLVVVFTTGGAGPIPGVQPPPGSLADPVPYDGRSPILVAETEQRVLIQLQRPPLGELANARAMGADAQIREIKSLKREQIALRGALEARGVRLGDVVSFYRVWNGFAATVKTSDIPQLSYPGSQVRSVRRLFPASSEPVSVPGASPVKPAGLERTPPIAVLDTGVDAKQLNEHADPGYDAVDRDRDPKPGSLNGRTETSGTALAGVVAALGQRVLPIRIASYRAVGGQVEAQSTTDELLAGIEHAVDPNGDGDTSDHVPIVLVGVNSPYAGFTTSPEAEAVKGAEGLGTLIVAPTGNEGAAAPGSGTIGSPASARDSLAVGALSGDEPQPRTKLTLDGEHIADAAVLAGDPPPNGQTAGPVSATDTAALGESLTRIRGKVVIVEAGANPAAQAAAAAAVGAKAVVIARPQDTPLPALSAGRAAAPVIGVTGEPAKQLLEAKPDTSIAFGDTERGPTSDAPQQPRISPNTSQGPTAGGLPKPDLAAKGSALSVGTDGKTVVVGGTAVAAAKVAVKAAELVDKRPDLTPAQLREQLIAAGKPQDLPPDRTGAGEASSDFGPITADPPSAVSGPLDPVEVNLATTVSGQVTFKTAKATVQPPTASLVAGTPTTVNVRLTEPGTVFGRLEVHQGNAITASVPWLVRPDEVDPVTVGALKVTGGRRVRFTLGSFKRGEQTEIQVAEKLVLDLVDADDRILRTLTVKGGAHDLMPAEYAYAIPRAQLPARDYAFRVRAWAPRQTDPTVQKSDLIRR
ncbi:S8 family serine peptidase [Solirubrobacter soli]|uniref:S8 family serine peptidase n=1 Tax=Solirubrobacter soli TaxID=363832 RepID=UPI0003FC2B94|nr:S8 family serine peptidase [Solirubrobacter soli]